MLSITIDWLAFNFKELTNEAENFMRDYARFPDTQNVAPRFGYTTATTDSNGTVIMWNGDREDMGHHVIFSGSTLRNLFERTKISQQSLLHAVVNSGGRISRLDLAKDLTGQAVDLQAIYQSLEQGSNRGTARSFAQIRSNDDGHTIYVGSRQSEKFIRIYNKASQSGLSQELWFRFELETKGMFSRALCKELVDRTEWSDIFDTTARGMVELGIVGNFQKFFSVGGVQIGVPKLERSSDRELWIDTQVIGAVLKHAVEHPDSRAVERLFSALKFVLGSGKIG